MLQVIEVEVIFSVYRWLSNMEALSTERCNYSRKAQVSEKCTDI